MNTLTAELSNLVHALDGLSVRHRETASNIANQSVPGYKRREVSFEDQLKRATADAQFRPKVSIDTSVGGTDGNNVKPEVEVGILNRVELTYQTLARVIAMKSAMTRAAISGR